MKRRGGVQLPISRADSTGRRNSSSNYKWASQQLVLSLLEFRLPNEQPLDSSEGGMRILFCPWCGRNLEQRYASPKS